MIDQSGIELPRCSEARSHAPPRAHKQKRPTLDWATLHARTWGVDVWRCPCGGTRTVTALVTSHRTAEEILRNLGLLPAPLPLPPERAPPQLTLPMP